MKYIGFKHQRESKQNSDKIISYFTTNYLNNRSDS